MLPAPRRTPVPDRPIAVAAGALALAAALAIGSLAVGVLGAEAKKQEGPCPYEDAGAMEINAAQAAEAIVCLINKERASRGVGQLSSHGQLATAAQRHSNRMVRRSCFDHVCPGEPGIAPRVRRTGYMDGASSMGIGENIAAIGGQRATPATTVKKWMNSPPHRETMLRGGFEHVGVGMSHGTPWGGRKGGGTFTADFGFVKG
jgi:uncharacterized protein YkwD